MDNGIVYVSIFYQDKCESHRFMETSLKRYITSYSVLSLLRQQPRNIFCHCEKGMEM